jgi:hypothetical protein
MSSPQVENDVESEALEWELRERREWRPRSWVPEDEEPLFLPTPSFMASAEKE